ASIEPAVTDFSDTFHRSAAVRAGDFDFVNPRAVQLRQRIHSFRITRALAQLSFAADDCTVLTRLTDIKRQRQSPKAATGNTPIPHIAQPVLHQTAAVLGQPAHRERLALHALTYFGAGDEPFVSEAEHQRRFAAPTDRVTMLVITPNEEDAFLL